MSATQEPELDFVVDVSSFTKEGFTGTTTYGGGAIEVEFEDGAEGIFLTAAMAAKLKVSKGSKLSVIVEDDKSSIGTVAVGGIAKKARVSDTRIYYAIGKEGGAILRIRKA